MTPTRRPSELADWAAEGVVEIVEGVHRIPVPLPDPALRATNAYLVRGTAGAVLIDPGWADPVSERALLKALAGLGQSPADLALVVATHAHLDHYSLALKLRADYACPVALGRGEQPSIIAGARTTEPLVQADQLRRCGEERLVTDFVDRLREGELPTELAWAEPDYWLESGDQIGLGGRGLHVIATPGHTRGHIVLRDEEHGLLFSGDHVLPHITPSVGFERLPEDLPVQSYLSSLDAMLAVSDSTLLPAHGPVLSSVHARVAELLDHHRLRLTSARDAVEKGSSTALEVAATFTWTRRQLPLDDLDIVHRGLAVIEIGAHLDVLAERGEVAAEDTSAIRHYRPL